MDLLKGGVDGFSYFSLIFNYSLLKPESSVSKGYIDLNKLNMYSNASACRKNIRYLKI
jgi:hypothetical protein